MTNPSVVTSHAERDASKQSRCSRYPWLKFMLFFLKFDGEVKILI